MPDSADVLRLYIDGASRGNPGPAAFAYVIEADGSPALEFCATLGVATNNVAEYTALVEALRRAGELGGRRLLVHSDSELLVKQMGGEYRVKSADLRALADKARALVRQFAKVTIVHIPRAKNQRADALCNQALDGNKPRPPAKRRTAGLSAARVQAARAEAIECLSRAAASWAAG